MSFNYSYVLPPTGLPDNSIIREMFDEIATAINEGPVVAAANKALSNLTGVAINTTLVSDTNNTDDLGTSGIRWRTGYFGTSVDILSTSTTALLIKAGATSIFTVDTTNFRVGINTGTSGAITLDIVSTENPLRVSSNVFGGNHAGGRLGSIGLISQCDLATPTAGDEMDLVNGQFKSSSGSFDEYAVLATVLVNNTVGSETARMLVGLRGGGQTFLQTGAMFAFDPISTTGCVFNVGKNEITHTAPDAGGAYIWADNSGAHKAGISGGAQPTAIDTFTARSTSATIIKLGSNTAGQMDFCTDTGLSSGSGFTPTVRASLTSTGFDNGFASSGASVILSVRNTSNTASSNAVLNVQVAGTTANDAFSKWEIVGGVVFSAGLDNSTTNDDWVVSRSSTLGTNNSIVIDGAAGHVRTKGIATTTAVPAGFVGEIIESSVANVNYGTSTQYNDTTSISLTAGIWMVFVSVVANANGATVQDVGVGVSTTTGNSATGLTSGINVFFYRVPAGAEQSSMSFMHIMSFTTTTTVYMKGYAQYTVATPRSSGTLRAVRLP